MLKLAPRKMPGAPNFTRSDHATWSGGGENDCYADTRLKRRLNPEYLTTNRVDRLVSESLNLDWTSHDLLHAVSHPLLYYHSILELTTCTMINNLVSVPD